MKIEIKEAGLTKIHSLPLVRQLDLDLLGEHVLKPWGQRVTGALPLSLSLFVANWTKWKTNLIMLKIKVGETSYSYTYNGIPRPKGKETWDDCEAKGKSLFKHALQITFDVHIERGRPSL